MTVKEVLQSLGSWTLTLDAALPDDIQRAIGFFGHVAIVRGKVDVDAAGDALLTRARYVGVLRDGIGRDGDAHTLEGVSTTVWLGDEDGKGQVLENKVVLTNATLTAALTAALPAAVHLGTVYPLADPAKRYTGTHRYEDPRAVITTICEAFGVEWRVNGDSTLDVGTQAQLYTAVPDSIVVRRGAGADLDLVALGGDFGVQKAAADYSDRVVLMGQAVTDGAEPFAIGSASAPSVPYLDRWGNPVKRTRLISESGQTTGSVTARAQLQLNRFNRTTTALKVTARDFETSGNFRVGDNTFVYDPDTGIVNPANQRDFRGELLHPDIVRVSEVSWPVSADHTVAFRTGAGVWLDLTRYVRWETGTNELVVGDLPKSLTNPATNVVRDRADAAPSTATPSAPTNLVLATTSVLNPRGGNSALILADWDAPTQNTDNTVVDLSHYLVQYRWTGRAPLWQSTVAGTTDIDLPATIDLDYEVRVAAVGRNGKTSAFTSTVAIRAAADTIAPPAPADPVATQAMGQSRIEYVGTSSTGTAMPSDTNRVDLHIGTTAGFTPTTATRVISFSPFAKGVYYATVPYGAAARWAKLVAVDHTGNVSAASAAVALTASQVVGPDVFDGAIGTAKLADLAVTNAKIGLLAVNDANIGSLNVGKLVSGTGTFELILAGTIQTAATGQRTGLNALGFFGYDTAGAKTMDLNGISNLLTGVFKTALAGRRIEIGAGGAVGEVNMYAPDGKRSFLRAHTESAGVEAIQFGIEVAGATSLWNRINYNSSVNGEYATYRSGTHEFIYDSTAPNANGAFLIFQTSSRGAGSEALRMEVSPTISSLAGPGSDARFAALSAGASVRYGTSGTFSVIERLGTGVEYDRILVNHDETLFQWAASNRRIALSLEVSTASSPSITLINGSNFGGLVKYHYVAGSSPEKIQIRGHADTYDIQLWCSSVVQSSSEAVKDDISAFDGDALALLRPMQLARYRRKRGTSIDGELAPAGQMELGGIAETAPAEIQAYDEDGAVYGVDHGAWLAVLTAAVRQLDARLAGAGGRTAA